MLALATFIQHCTRGPCQCNKARERNEIHKVQWTEINTIAFFYRYDCLKRKYQTVYKKLLELISEFSKIQGYKVKIDKSTAFLSISNERMEIEL